MVVIIYGTSAELIKMYGIIKNIPRDQQYIICNAQQYAGLQKVHKQLDIEPDLYIAKGWFGQDVANMRQMLLMMFKSHGKFARQWSKVKKIIRETDKIKNTKSVVLVHGDTLTTVVGSYLGRLLGLPVGHVEAGLRSGSWKNPFPEELDRRLATKIARIHFAPNELAEKNLRDEKVKGEIINTRFNTAKDAIEQSDRFVSQAYYDLNLPKHYLLVLLHRTELLENKRNFENILRTIHSHAKQGNNVVFTMHTTTSERIKSYGFGYLLDQKNICIIHKQPYFDFMAIVKNADYIITDGGGLQEDSYFLGIPVVIHRERTERQEGLGFNAQISKMDIKKVEQFLSTHMNKNDFQRLNESASPSLVVTEYLSKRGYINQ